MKHIALASIAALTLSACASNGPGGQRPPPQGGPKGEPGPEFDGGKVFPPIALLFVSMDSDGDKRLSREELAEGTRLEWISLAADGTGAVSPFEFKTWSEVTFGVADSLPSRISFDTDLDGRITAEEFAARLDTEFSELDKNGDGVLNRSEMLVTIARPRMGPSGMGQRPPQGGRGDKPPPPR